MINKNYKFCLLISYSFLMAACLPRMTPHENFVDLINGFIGKNIDSIPYYQLAKSPLETKVLKNGNIENKYMSGKSCFYYLEVDGISHVVMSVRYEGGGRDCSLAF